MQNGSLNGTLEHHDNQIAEQEDSTPQNPSVSIAQTEPVTSERIPSERKEDDVPIEHQDGPPSKKRKLAGSGSSSERSSRPPSPPWKRVAHDGPSSFVENGRRKSSRTNAIPLELLPQSGKRHTRSTHQDYINKAKPSHSSWKSSSPPIPGSNGRRFTNGKAAINGAETTPSIKDSLRSPSTRRQSNLQTPTLHSSLRTRAQSIQNSQPVHALTNGKTPVKSQQGVRYVATPKGMHNSAVGNGADGGNEHESPGGTVLRVPRLRLSVKRPSLDVYHPGHVLPPRRFSSFREWADNDAWEDNEVRILTEEEALQEARMRMQVTRAGGPGQLLSKDRCSEYLTDPAEEPPQQYSHQDHLIAHALFFKKLLDKERKHHRNLAKLFAHWCADAWRKRNKRPEDILREQQEETRQRHKQVFKDLQRQFDLVRAEIEKRKLARWEQEKKIENKLALNKAIKQSAELFERGLLDRVGDTDADGEEDISEVYSESGISVDDQSKSDAESNMSASETSDEENHALDDDANLSPEALRAKYAHLSSVDFDTNSTSPKDPLSPSTSPILDEEDGPIPSLDELDPLLLDDSEDSTDMDDDMGDSDEEIGTEDEESSGDEPGLLGFFSRKEFTAAESGAETEEKLPEAETQDEQEIDDEDEVLLVPNGQADEDQLIADKEHDTPMATISLPNNVHQDGAEPSSTPADKPKAALDAQASDESEDANDVSRVSEASVQPPLSAAELDPQDDKSITANFNEEDLIPIPHLLRGTLREYQHAGVTWLADLYKDHINGILADEMGLGKTIQTIALLAHLAVAHEVWGPHLIVVPTSVMLNWEMEFKKWCPGFKILTYYGSQEERRQKRKGWMDDDRWHVCITSYQLVLQDQQTFKRRNWHYMVLDEAHNIKNFRSQRWQTLLTFKSRARLLLTGTPLQNNLTELWSLLFFLMPSDDTVVGRKGFANLREFSEWFHSPVEQILEHGKETMDAEAAGLVKKLHMMLRPYLLRRLKIHVEKQMPGKYEHVVMCRLSKRQRFLYDGFMSRAQTKETLASGNYLSIINCLMQLRKVCNHPDLFETRPIMTSFAMPRSAIADFEIKELLVRRHLLDCDISNRLSLNFLNLAPISREHLSKGLVDDSTRIMAYGPLRVLRERQYNRTNWNMEFDGSSIQSTLVSMENTARKGRMGELESCLYFESKRHGQRPIYGKGLIEFLTINTDIKSISRRPPQQVALIDWLSRKSSVLASMVLSIQERAMAMESYVQEFACITPAAIANGITEAALTPISSRSLTNSQKVPNYDPFHEAQMRLSIAFPDKRLLQYDCGKLQQLDKLLRKLKAGGHRALIFTQMTKMLDILEQFLNIHGHRYLRLDGATKVEQRQILTERFNNDNRILAFILSSRSGGLGINLTGADTVIFYDLDWNPAMDKQCQDRCHRIGQTRDVHIYRFVSEYTIESNILRKANQKRLLDDVVIQQGEFTTDYFQKLNVRDMLEDNPLDGHDEASAAMDRVLNTGTSGTPRAFEQAEDKEDIDAAKIAVKELQHVDDGDFEEGSAPHTPGQPGTSQAGTPLPVESSDHEQPAARVERLDASANPESSSLAMMDRPTSMEPEFGHIDDYLLNFMEWNLKDEPLMLPPDKSRRKSRKGQDHRVRRRR
ncbi:hypothetical protein AJ80_05001 [Polytolypa hystricis UAMH7299]|uniref:DNA helicase n=1 Tax=Polytolypa hystricis (strain UAMH7299) TaxID=1447883 RepID=A0A2B7Y7B1_POLH7|nr:hypothetical protein AJ80_05001 [Polytolypa hystricis UAMH7299]